VEFNPVNPVVARARRWRVSHRDHRKLLVVDGKVAFLGGINISEVYSSGSFMSKRRRRRRPASTPAGWRDTHLRIEGPVVAEFQKLFLETWSAQDGPEIDGGDYLPVQAAAGDAYVRAIGTTPRDRGSTFHLTMLSALHHAQARAWFTVAYFAPDGALFDALTGAAMRGADVRMIMPCRTDSWPIFHCGRSYYEALLEAGVRIYERQGSIMHAKTAVIDGVWSTVGSSNLDWRSMYHNDELNAVVLGAEFGQGMEDMFSADLEESKEITLAQWRVRPLPSKALEWAARAFERSL
jgi:cardiolipin synthase